MTERPIPFSAPMVRALLEGRKTQTRRIIKLPTKGIYEHPKMGGWEPTAVGGGGCFRLRKDGTHEPVPEMVGIWHRTRGICIAAAYQPGDVLWVRETWRSASMQPNDVIYRADGESLMAWRSSSNMPRWASRVTLRVTDVRVQRLQEISEEDARAEGCPVTWDGKPYDPPKSDSWQGYGRYSFCLLWNSIHGPGAWDANPWVAVIEFKRINQEPANG